MLKVIIFAWGYFPGFVYLQFGAYDWADQYRAITQRRRGDCRGTNLSIIERGGKMSDASFYVLHGILSVLHDVFTFLTNNR